MNLDDYFTTGFACAAAFLSWFIGDLGGIVKVLVVLVIVDQTTGVLKAIVLGTWSSDVGFHGIANKVFIFMMVGVANIFDNEMLAHSELLHDGVCFFYIANEGLSIMENAIEMGAPFHDVLKERFLVLRNKQLVSKNTPDDE